MESTYLEHFPHGNWTGIDDETLQEILKHMEPTGFEFHCFRDQDQEVVCDDHVFEQINDGIQNPSTEYRGGTDKPRPPGLSATEASWKTEPVPQAATEGGSRSTVQTSTAEVS